MEDASATGRPGAIGLSGRVRAPGFGISTEPVTALPMTRRFPEPPGSEPIPAESAIRSFKRVRLRYAGLAPDNSHSGSEHDRFLVSLEVTAWSWCGLGFSSCRWLISHSARFIHHAIQLFASNSQGELLLDAADCESLADHGKFTG